MEANTGRHSQQSDFNWSTPYDPEADPKNNPNPNNELRPLFLSLIGTMLIFLTLGTIAIASCLTEGCNWLTDQRFINDTSAIGDVTGVYSFDRATRDELLTKGLIADGDGKLALFKDGSVRRLDGHLVIRTFERTQQSQVCLGKFKGVRTQIRRICGKIQRGQDSNPQNL